MTVIGSALLGGAAGLLSAPAAMMLDDVMFSGPEVPSSIRIGGGQRLVIHRLPGGRRILDMMGPDESAIEWRGLLVGPGASAKAMLLSSMRRLGGVRQLSFGDAVFGIVVVQFEYAYQAQGLLIPYSLRAEVVPDGSVSIAGDQVAGSTASADIGSGSGFVGVGMDVMNAYGGLAAPSARGGVAALSGDLGEAATGLSDLLGSSAAATGSTALSSVQQALEACLDEADVGASVPLDQVGSASGLVSQLLGCAASASAAMARGYAARAGINSS